MSGFGLLCKTGKFLQSIIKLSHPANISLFIGAILIRTVRNADKAIRRHGGGAVARPCCSYVDRQNYYAIAAKPKP